MHLLKITIFLFLLFVTANLKAQDMVQPSAALDSLMMPVFDYTPKVIKVKKDGKRFLEQEVKMLNRGGSRLIINNVIPSCKCGTFKVLRGFIEPMGIGKLILSLNLDAMIEGQEMIEFVVESNAKNSPVTIKFEVIED